MSSDNVMRTAAARARIMTLHTGRKAYLPKAIQPLGINEVFGDDVEMPEASTKELLWGDSGRTAEAKNMACNERAFGNLVDPITPQQTG